jgi:CutA1 divalent ion tolerance protein
MRLESPYISNFLSFTCGTLRNSVVSIVLLSIWFHFWFPVEKCQMSALRVVWTTCETAAEAQTLARGAVQARIAACAQVSWIDDM